MVNLLLEVDASDGVNHPKGLGELEVPREGMEGWAERCYSLAQLILNAFLFITM